MQMCNEDFETVDIHTHISRDLRQEKAAFRFPGRRDRDRWATPERLTAYMDRCGITKLAFLNLFPTNEIMASEASRLPPNLSDKQHKEELERISREIAGRIRRHNEWACDLGKRYPRLIPFIGIQKVLGLDGMCEEVVMRAGQGARGVKLHPALYRFYPNDRELWPVYEQCQRLGLAVLCDSTFLRGEDEANFGEPYHFVEVLKNFPNLILILAHLGSVFWDERIEIAQQFHNVYFDTAWGFSAVDRVSFQPRRDLAEEDAPRIMRRIGVDRILFGSDAPYSDAVMQIEQILRLPLSSQEKKLILSENAKRILGI